MKIRCETWQEKEARLFQWHRFYAWHPVLIGQHIACFEMVERKGKDDFDGGVIYEYRALTSEVA